MLFRFICFALILAVLSACGQLNKTEHEAMDRPPNIILIYTDDHGYADLGIMGLKADIRTPHIDAMARRGVLFTQGYVTAPTCVPSRAGLLTGQHQNSFGLDTNQEIRDRTVQARFQEIETIAERLRGAGYETGMSGKWHLGSHKRIPDHGFDQYWLTDGQRDAKNFDPDSYGIATNLVENGYHIDQSSALAAAFINKNKDKPFFFYWAPRAPHVPLDAPQNYLDRFGQIDSPRRQQGLAMMSAVDDGVGNIVESLEDHNLLNNTLIFFISDNGAPLRIDKRENGPVVSGWDGSLNDPLTGEKGLLMEGGIRVPFIVSWPGRLPMQARFERPVTSLDVAPTIYKAADIMTDDKLHGTDLVPFLLGKTTGDPHQNLFWKHGAQEAVRSGDWKLIKFEGVVYLYDLDRDISEQENLAESRPSKLQALEASLDEWIAGLPVVSNKNERLKQKQIQRKKIFYDHYLEGKVVDIDRLYLDWLYDMSESDLYKGHSKKTNPPKGQ